MSATALVVVIGAALAGTGAQAQTTTQQYPDCVATPTDSGSVADFGVGVAASPKGISVAQGGAATTVLTLTPFNSYSGYVTLSCANLTPDSECGFVPVDVFVGGTASSKAELSITTYGPTGPDALLAKHARLFYAMLLPGMLGLAGLGLRARATLLRSVVLPVVALAAIVWSCGLLGCSQRYHYLHKQPAASTGTAIGSSTFILEAQSISGTVVITHACTLPLTVTAP